MNYIIWKDIKSTEIKGLIICELPPITKPKMRVQETIIDGVDGSLIEELGYESYDKEIKIGLTKGFNIDEVIKYFNGESNIIFSNEPNKYYKAKIIEQIDYTRLLRFKEAVITFRVQPFKYEYLETSDILTSESVEGTEVEVINENNKKISAIRIEGKVTQETTTGKNKLPNNSSSQTTNGVTFTKNTDGSILVNGTATSNIAITLTSFLELSAGDYILNGCPEGGSRQTYLLGTNAPNSNVIDIGEGVEFSLSEDITEKQVWLNVYSGAILDNLLFKPMIRLATEEETFEKYTDGKESPSMKYPSQLKKIGIYNNETKNREIILTNGSSQSSVQFLAPLRSIDNLKDILYIADNRLYIERHIGEITLKGTEEWKYQDNDGFNYFHIDNVINSNFYAKGSSTHFICKTSFEDMKNTESSFTIRGDGTGIHINGGDINNLEDFKNWLSENNVEVLYPLKESYTEELGGINLFELEKGINVISNNVNANMIINYIDDKILVKNKGNYISKPILKIKGYGPIEITLNNNKLFRYVFLNWDEEVIIDSSKQDAYLGNVLKNRNMSGEFPIFEIGENIITWDGCINEIEVSSKSRWL